MMARWNRVNDMDQLRREIDQVFNAFFTPTERVSHRLAFLPGYAARQYPLINLREERDNYHVEALAPGIDPEKINISITGNVLTLSGEKMKISEQIEPQAFHRSERAAGRFVRAVELPTDVNRDRVEAEYKNGILFIHLPKAEEAKPKEIHVRIE